MTTVVTGGGDDQHSANIQNQEIRDKISQRRLRAVVGMLLSTAWGVSVFYLLYTHFPFQESIESLLKSKEFIISVAILLVFLFFFIH